MKDESYAPQPKVRGDESLVVANYFPRAQHTAMSSAMASRLNLEGTTRTTVAPKLA